MIPKSLIENTIYFDIETVGAYSTLNECKEKDKRLYDLWLKRCKWLVKNIKDVESSDPADLWLNNSALHPEFGKIVCISFGVFEGSLERVNSFYGENEIEILESANKILTNARVKGYKLAGQNIKKFDIPYIGKRMLIHSITPDSMIYLFGRKPWDMPFLDLGEIFAFGAFGQSFSSLDLISHSLGIPSPKDNLDGSLVHSHYWDLHKVDEIKDYCEEDVVCTMKCFQKLSS